MSKEVIRPSQFCNVKAAIQPDSVHLELSDAQLQELSDLYQGLFEHFKPGNVIKGMVVSVDSDGVLVDVQYKSRGYIPKYEFSEHELKKIKAGDEIEVMLDELESADGTVVLSYEKARAIRAWDVIMKLFEEGKPVEGMVTHKVKGGLNVDIGVPAFLPGSQIDLQRVTDFDHFVGQTITANILKVNQKRGNVIISRRKYLHDQRSDARKNVLDKIGENAVLQGIVKNITNYGAFIDIGGVDGLLHITDMTWGRIAHPSEMLRIGDTITVKVLSFDKDNQKISLGLKQLDKNPWAGVDETLHVGDRIKGRISSITDYGLFVEVAKGIEGLVHISEISWTDRINNLAQRYNVGDQVEVLVVSLDKENRRMSLSIKQMESNPWQTLDQNFKIGQHIKGSISNITDFGIFVQIMPGIDGLVHISDLSWTEHIDHPGDRYKIGQQVEAVILSIDQANKKISLGVKQLDKDPWETVEQDYPINTVVNGVVSKITNFGAFIKFASGIEGLIHNTTLVEHQGKKAEEVLKVGQEAEFRVINVNKDDRKLGLTMKLEKSANEQPFVKKRVAGKPEYAKDTATSGKETHAPRERQPRRNDNTEFVSTSTSGNKGMKSSFQVAFESAVQERDAEAKKNDTENND